MKLRQNWTLSELMKLYELPFLELISKAHSLHIQCNDPSEIQVCNLISIKTGGCPEDCKYCAQSSRYQTSISALNLMKCEEVVEEAKKAASRGVTRICLGAAWREVRSSKQFDEILKMVEEITHMGIEVCCTLGMLKTEHAKQLKKSGLYAYNHNLDSSENYYKNVATTRTYQDRLNTLDTVQQAGISVCCGGILGLGESVQDRLELLLTIANRDQQPESVPINQLSPIPGTPFENNTPLSIWDMVRIIAIARILMPKALIRLSSGRIGMSHEQQALCFLAGANSIFVGDKLLTVANNSPDSDLEMFNLLGLKKRPAFKRGGQ